MVPNQCAPTYVDEKEALCQRLWTLAHLFSLVLGTEWTSSLLNSSWGFVPINSLLAALVFFICVMIIWRPSFNVFGSLLVTQILFSIASLPDLPNHRYLLSFVNLGLIFCCYERRFFNDCSRFFIRLVLIIVYFFAAFHKINSGFLDPSTSCGGLFLENIRLLLPFFPRIDPFLPVSTIILEALIPLLLFSPKGYRFAALLALVLHGTLSFDYIKLFINFSGVMLALFAILLLRNIPQTLFLSRSLFRGICAFTVLFYGAHVLGFVGALNYIFVVHSLFLTWLVGVAFIFVSKAELPAQRFNFAALFVANLLLLNAASPYLGIKNRGAFNMYSNLVINHEISNHLLVGRSLDLFGFAKNPPLHPWDKVFPFQSSSAEDAKICRW